MQKGIKESVIEWLLGFSTNYLQPDLQITVISDEPHGEPDEGDKHDNAGEEFREQIQEKYIDLTCRIEDFDTVIVDTSNRDWDKYSKNIANKIEEKYIMEG